MRMHALVLTMVTAFVAGQFVDLRQQGIDPSAIPVNAAKSGRVNNDPFSNDGREWTAINDACLALSDDDVKQTFLERAVPSSQLLKRVITQDDVKMEKRIRTHLDEYVRQNAACKRRRGTYDQLYLRVDALQVESSVKTMCAKAVEKTEVACKRLMGMICQMMDVNYTFSISRVQSLTEVTYASKSIAADCPQLGQQQSPPASPQSPQPQVIRSGGNRAAGQ